MSKRILFATDRDTLPQRTGGQEATVHELCGALARRGHAAAVLCGLTAKGAIYWRNRVQSRLIGDKAPRDLANGYATYRAWSVLDSLDAVCDAFAPDGVVVNKCASSIALLERLKRRGVRTLLYLHDNEGGLDPARFAEVANGFDELTTIANSKFTAENYNRLLGAECVILRPLVDRARVKTTPSGRKVIFINPVRMKGVDLAFEIAKTCPDFEFLFFENWPDDDRDKVRARAKSFANIELRRATRDPKNLYKEGCVLLAPSQRGEAWGRVVTEAQINGLPVIASRVGGLPEAVGAGGALLAPDDPCEAWAAALRRLMTDEAHYADMRRKALARAAEADICEDGIIDDLLAWI